MIEGVKKDKKGLNNFIKNDSVRSSQEWSEKIKYFFEKRYL